MITFLDKAGVYGILSNNKETLNKSLKVTTLINFFSLANSGTSDKGLSS